MSKVRLLCTSIGCVFLVLCTMLYLPSTSAQTTSAPLATISVPVTPMAKSISRDEVGTVLVDNQPAEIQDLVLAQSEPLVFAVLVDISGSSKEQEAFERESAVRLFRALSLGSNVGFFGDFNDELYFSDKPASPDSVLNEFKNMGRFRGGTALYDAISVAARRVSLEAQGTQRRRAVFVLTDGNDNASRISLKEAIKRLQTDGVPVFCIGLKGQQGVPDKALNALFKISESTGGIVHLLDHPDDFVPTVVAEIQNQYWLKLSSPVMGDGKLHLLVIKRRSDTVRIAAPTAVLVR